jgi:hypothetical protein
VKTSDFCDSINYLKQVGKFLKLPVFEIFLKLFLELTFKLRKKIRI